MSNQTLRGPFRSASLGDEHYTQHGVYDEGQAYSRIPADVATQLFLERFPPEAGWSVQVEGSLMELDMRALAERHNSGASLQPVVRFVATLTDPSGRVINRASTAWVLTGATDWERGETNARMRLYQAMGLPVIRLEGGAAQQLPAQGQIVTVGIAGIAACESSIPERYRSQPSTSASEPVQANADQANAEPAAPTEAEAVDQEQPPAAESQANGQAPEAGTTESTEVAAPRRQRKSRAGDDDPPSDSMLATIRTAAAMRGVQVPTLATKGAAKQFLAELNGA